MTIDMLEGVHPNDIQEVISTPSKFVEEIIGIEPFEYQKGVLDTDNDRVAFVSGRQVGKSRTAAWVALHHALTSPGHQILITAPVQRQSSQLFKQVKKEMGESAVPTNLWGTERETRTVIEFDNGSEILCLPTGDGGATIRGYTADHIIVDEAAFVEDEVFEQALMPMLATTDGDLTLLSTPYGDTGYLYNAFHDKLEDDYFTEQVPTYQSPLVGDEFVSNQQEQLSNTNFKQEILGQFVESQTTFFQEDQVENAVEPNPDTDNSRMFLGVDLARHGTDRSVYITMDAAGNVAHIASDQDTSLAESIGQVKYLHDMYNYEKIVIDETAMGGGVVDMLKDDLQRGLVEGVKFTISTKQSIYNTLKEKLESGEVTIPDNKDLKREMLDLRREFTGQGKMKIHHPDGGTDDYCDSLALAAYAYENGNRVRQTSSVSL